jgi:serine O-acetyltransferase
MATVRKKSDPLEPHASSRSEGHTYRSMKWQSLYKQDIARFKKHREHASVLNLCLTEQGLWALLQYRMASTLYRTSLPMLVKAPLLALMLVWQKLIEIVTGITLPHQATIGPGLYIGHYGNIILSPGVVIGHTCNLSQGVTIGVSGRGHRRGVPIIGNRVYIAAHAVVAGKISIGDDAVIAANSLVVSDVATHTTVMGVPAQMINTNGSETYLDPLPE